MAGSRERVIANFLKRWITALGGFIVKIAGEGYNGIPDYLIAHAGKLYLVETKRPKGGALSDVQIECHKKFARRGVIVRTCFTKEEVIDFLYEICTA